MHRARSSFAVGRLPREEKRLRDRPGQFLPLAVATAQAVQVLLTQGPDAFFSQVSSSQATEGEVFALLDTLKTDEPATVSDRTDGKIAHLDGLNLSRAWCWRSIAHMMDAHDPRRQIALDAAKGHLRASLPHIGGDYMGSHWLATFALLALR